MNLKGVQRLARTSEKFEHIFNIASRTVICSSVKPEVSMIRRREVTLKHRVDCREGVHVCARKIVLAGLIAKRCIAPAACIMYAVAF